MPLISGIMRVTRIKKYYEGLRQAALSLASPQLKTDKWHLCRESSSGSRVCIMVAVALKPHFSGWFVPYIFNHSGMKWNLELGCSAVKWCLVAHCKVAPVIVTVLQRMNCKNIDQSSFFVNSPGLIS